MISIAGAASVAPAFFQTLFHNALGLSAFAAKRLQ